MHKGQLTINTTSQTGTWQIFAKRKSAVNRQPSTVKCSQKGALLLELLVAISILAAVLSVGSQAVYVSMQSGKTSAESDVAMGLANEALEAVRGTTEEKWQNIYDLAGKGTTHYKPTLSAGKWTLTSGDEAVQLNTANYTRYVVVSNISRDLSTRMIETTYNAAHDDPSTQQVAVTVSWQGTGSPVMVSDYFLRWRNKVCPQTSWAGGASSGVKTCPDTTYTSSTNLGTPGASLQIQ